MKINKKDNWTDGNEGRFFLALSVFVVGVFLITPHDVPLYGAASEFGVELDAEMGFERSEVDLSPWWDSEVELVYETDSTYFESETLVDQGVYSDQELMVGFIGNDLNGELDLSFDPEEEELESCRVGGTLSPNPVTTVEVDYETESCLPRNQRSPERELEVEVEREAKEGVEVVLTSTFPRGSGGGVAIPEESSLEVDALPFENFSINPILELEQLVPVELKVDLEDAVLFEETEEVGFESEVDWEFSDDYAEFDPELTTERFVFSLESDLRFSADRPGEVVRINELELGDVELGEWQLDFTRDFSQEETELAFETEPGALEVELELLFEDAEFGVRPEVGELGGKASFDLNERTELVLESETEFESRVPEVTLSFDYSL
ncbi:MAG: hypothetical protein ACOC86_04960 [Candidatus Bipolaricaulota bacterium]